MLQPVLCHDAGVLAPVELAGRTEDRLMLDGVRAPVSEPGAERLVHEAGVLAPVDPLAEPGEERLVLDGVLAPVKTLPAFECPAGVEGVDRAPQPGAAAAREGVDGTPATVPSHSATAPAPSGCMVPGSDWPPADAAAASDGAAAVVDAGPGAAAASGAGVGAAESDPGTPPSTAPSPVRAAGVFWQGGRAYWWGRSARCSPLEAWSRWGLPRHRRARRENPPEARSP